MNHGVTICTNDGEVIEFGLAWFCSVAQWFEVMHLCVISTKLAINNLEIKRNQAFTLEFAISKLSCFSDFGITQ